MARVEVIENKFMAEQGFKKCITRRVCTNGTLVITQTMMKNLGFKAGNEVYVYVNPKKKTMFISSDLPD